MKQIISDFIHLTQMEFLIKHPFVIIGMFVVMILFWELNWFIWKKSRLISKKKEGVLIAWCELPKFEE